MARFSLVPGKSLDIVGIPDIEAIKKFASGDLGISKSMMDDSYKKQSAGLSGETLSTFTKLSKNGTQTENGLPAMEKVIVKSMLETQKPYMEVALAVIQSLVVIEDVIAVSLAGIESQSLKPKTNDESLYTKMNKLEDKLTEIQTEIKPDSNSFRDISESDRLNGISLEQLGEAYKGKSIKISENSLNDYNWEIISTEYSTGIFISTIPYIYTYRNIEEEDIKKQTSKFEIIKVKVPDNKPNIIFDVYISENGDRGMRKITDLSELPEEWDISDRWEGSWENWSNDKSKFNQQYSTYVKKSLSDGMIENGITNSGQRNEVTDIVVNSLPINSTNIDFHKEIKKSSFQSEKNIESSNIGQFLNQSGGFGYQPKKVNGEWIDPESDYHLQIISIIPSTDETPPEDINIDDEKISINTPLVHNYNGNDIKDVLFTSDYTQKEDYYTPDDFRESNIHTKIRKRLPDITGDLGSIHVDKKVYYIIEGIYKDRKEVNKNSTPQSGEEWYKFGPVSTRFGLSISKMVSKFIKFGTTFLPLLLLKITSAIKLLNNPFNFIFEIVMENMSSSFSAFSPETLKKFVKLKTIQGVKAKKEFIKQEPSLKNIVAFDDKDNYRYIFDGAGVTSLFGHNFGIGIKSMSPKLISEKNGTDALGCNETPPNRGNDIDDGSSGTSDSDQQSNRLVGSTYEIVNTEYSTGDYIEGTDYTYYYITLDNESLINKAEEQLRRSKGLDKANSISLKLDAMENYQKALVKDPSNLYLNDQVNKLQKDEGIQTNMMLQFIIDMIALPIKIILCIIDYILNFFKTMKILEIPKKVPEFFKFKWILEFLKPSKIFDLLGIKLNPIKVSQWSTESVGAPPSLKFDTSQIISAPFLGKLPKFNAKQFLETIKGGSKIGLSMGAILKFMEQLMNEMICFILNMFNIDKLFTCPTMNLSRFGEESLKQSDIDKLLNEGDYNFLNDVDQPGNNVFVFDITLENGDVVRGLNQRELDAFISSNRNLKYKYS